MDFRPGDVVWYYSDNGGWRTGRYLRTAERTAEDSPHFGMCVIVPSHGSKTGIYVRPEDVTLAKSSNPKREAVKSSG